MADNERFRSDFVAGAAAIVPVLPAAATVGLVTGVAATAAGLAPVQAVATSVLVYFPSVLLAAFDLLDAGIPTPVVAVTALVVGVRSAMLSLSIAPYFSRLSAGWRWLLAYFLWTPTYALSVERFEADPATSRRGFYLGTAVPTWATLQLSVAASVVFGTAVPAAWELEFVVPLAFLALVMRFLADRAARAAAVVAGVVAVLGSAVPLNLGIVVAALVGTAAGLLLHRGWRR